MLRIPLRTLPIRWLSLNNLGSNPAAGALKYDVSAGSKDTGVACLVNATLKSIRTVYL